MKLTCSQKELNSALGITSKAVDANSTLPVLNNVLLQAEGKRLSFTTTNLEIAIRYWIETDIKNEGQITIPSKLLTSYVGYLKDDKVDISAEDGDAVLVQTSDSKTKIKGIAATEFPPIPMVEKEGEVVVSSDVLLEGINQVVFAASLNTTRPILAGVYFNVGKDSLTMAATDSYRLSEKTVKVQKSSGEISCIIPAKTMIEVAHILGSLDKKQDVTVVISKNQVLFTVDKIEITSRLIEGQFPNYQQIIPKESKTTVTISTSDLSLDLKRVNLFAKENNNKIILSVSGSGIKITSDSTQLGEGTVELKAKVDGADSEIAVNSQYMLDVLGSLGTDEATLKLGEKVNPMIVQPTGKEGYTHIIMPLKI